MSTSLSAVLLLKIGGKHYRHNVGRARLLLLSMQRYGVHETLGRLTVVAPGDELPTVRRSLDDIAPVPVTYLSDDDVLVGMAGASSYEHTRPWRRQQMLKLAFTHHQDDDFVMTFDPDVFARRPVAADEFVRDGRARLHLEPASIHTDWWAGSGALLGVDPTLESGMGVTPAILSREVLGSLRQAIEDRSEGRRWLDVLSDTPHLWTEYSLYYLHALRSGLLDRYHFAGEMYGDASVWDHSEMERLSAETVFGAGDTSPFCVIQSWTKITPEEILAIIDPSGEFVIGDYPRPWALGARVADLRKAVVARWTERRRTASR